MQEEKNPIKKRNIDKNIYKKQFFICFIKNFVKALFVYKCYYFHNQQRSAKNEKWRKNNTKKENVVS